MLYKVVMGFNTRYSKYVWESLPHVSVIIPAYNNGQFIDFTLQSIFRQTYPKEKIEIIVVDDGSTDNTAEILERYRERLLFIRQNNKGIANARNRGMSLAQGEIITFFDADDIWYEERIGKIVERFRERQDCGIVYHPIELIDTSNKTIYTNFYKAYGYKEGLSGWITNKMLYGQIFCGGSSFAFKKEVLERTYPIPEDIQRGIDYYMAVISSCFAPVEYIPEILGKYRFHGKNITMLAGQRNYRELGEVNRDFAHTRQKIIEKLIELKMPSIKMIDLDILRRNQAKELIFYHILNGKRSHALKHLPLLYQGKLRLIDLLRAVAVSFMSLFVPAGFFTKLIRVHEILIRAKVIRF